MTAAVAALAIVAMLAALSVLGPSALPKPPAHLRAPDPARRRLPEPVADAIDRAIDRARARGPARWAVTAMSIVLLAGAVFTIGYPFFTNLQQDRLQSRLDRQLQSGELRAAYLQRQVAVGDSLTRIVIPDIRVEVVVVEGTTQTALRAGAGHYANTPLPCEIGNVAIAGHRTTYGRPFHNLDQLELGQEITLETPLGRCTYQVDREPFVVSPDAIEVLANTPDEATLTLTTCHPKGSARERLIVTATLVRSESAAA